jgi:hypothetical protein
MKLKPLTIPPSDGNFFIDLIRAWYLKKISSGFLVQQIEHKYL